MASLFLHHFPQSVHRLAVIGMVHVRGLPGSPRSHLSVQELVDKACEEAQIFVKHELDGVCLENMFDAPYVTNATPEVVATMARVASEVRRVCPRSMPCGIQILAGLNHEALAVALAADLQFVRVEGFVFGHLADEGLIQSCAGTLLRYRRQIGADHVAIVTDIKKKHSAHAITADVDIVDTAKAAAFFLTDGLILTGKETGHSVDLEQVTMVRTALSHIPLLVGSGVTPHNLESLVHTRVNAAIVGSYFKHRGQWQNEICQQRVADFMLHLKRLNSSNQ